MMTSIFASAFHFLSTFVAHDRTSAASGSGTNYERDQDGNAVVHSFSEAAVARSGKRKAEDDNDERDTKRRWLRRGQPSTLPYADEVEVSGINIQSLPASLPFSFDATEKAKMDRSMMPPPPTPHRTVSYLPRRHPYPLPRPETDSTTQDEDSISFDSTSMIRRRAEDIDEDQMEEARRHAAAVTLPPNSGIWTESEQELFFHLAYRGFEPLLPRNWMIDFDTLPISLFAHEDTDDVPLVQNIRDNHFRASHALRRLFEAGHDVRDRNHLSPTTRREKILERAVKRYLYWALTDVGLRPTRKASFLPVHSVVTRRNGKTTLQTLEEVASKLHRLSVKHQHGRGILLSIETSASGILEVDEPRVAEDNGAITLFGLVVISSVVAIVTLSPFSQASAPSQPSVRQTASPPYSDHESAPTSDFNPDRLRIIAELDFSQKDQDVWNALGLAIVAMQIRREAIKANLGMSYQDIDALDGDTMSMAGSRFEEELEERFGNSLVVSVENDDDPDL